MASPAPAPALSAEVDAQIASLRPRDVAVGVLTYNNASTVKTVATAAALGIEKHVAGASAAFVNADAGSSDGTADALSAAGLPVVSVPYAAPPDERVTVPFHGVPGRGTALRTTFEVARRLEARVLVLLEADVQSITEEWMARLVGPVLEEHADYVSPVYARHRYDSTIPTLLLAPLVSRHAPARRLSGVAHSPQRLRQRR